MTVARYCCRILSFTCVLFACLYNVGVRSQATDEVLILDNDNFNDELALWDRMLVMFYAPWCPHSQQLLPEWDKAAELLANNPVQVAKLDTDANEDIARRYKIRNLPTLKYFKNGNPTDYRGPRAAAAIAQWGASRTISRTTTIKTLEDVEALQEKYDVFVLGVFSSLTSPAVKAYQALADDDEDSIYVWTMTASDEIKDKLFYPRKIGSKEFILVLKNFDELRADFAITGKFNTPTIKSFVQENSIPIVVNWDPLAWKKISAAGMKHHLFFITDPTKPHHNRTMQAYSEVGAEFKSQLSFINVPISEEKIIDFFSIDKSKLPSSVIIDFSDDENGMKKYVYRGQNQGSSISKWVKKFVDGDLKAELKSEKETLDDTTGNVVVLRGTSFADLVLNNDKDVFVEFYAPWCGHCKALAPIWEELGEHFEDNSNMIIAKMDATANEIEVDGVEVESYPQLYLFPANDKSNPIHYQGERELEGFVSFLEEQVPNLHFRRYEL
mmetsp:Transcript_30763/g.52034  ORF Transcript_30763/g.52034 Transcript_30763/m.52034 type:complete len:498 (+) Transcript_30763:36-1529(+)